MATKPASIQIHVEEEKLGRALVGRGLLTIDELKQCRASSDSSTGAQALLDRLVQAGFLTPYQAQRVAPEIPALVAQHIPGYQLLDKLGQGAMGTVYKARQLSMNRLVAVKVLNPRQASNPKYLERFTHEAHLAARLSHNNVVQAIDVGSTGSINYFVMEYVEGTTIMKEIEAGKIYEEREALDIVVQIAQALEHAHHRDLIHRDIKPANIILTKEGIAKLADLGIARESANLAKAKAEKGLTIGTPYYIAPEQVQGREDVDNRVDIYSLGATFYHMVTGKPPFVGDQINDVFKAHLLQPLTPPDHLNTKLSAGLGEVVEFMMAKDRDRRYRTAGDLIIDLECLISDKPPKLARERIEAATLSELSEGEEQNDDSRRSRGKDQSFLWIGVLGTLLALSLLLNLVLFLSRP